MALSADAARHYGLEEERIEGTYPAQVDVTYGGSAMSFDANGDCGPLLTSETFAGFAVAKVDNSGGSAGDKDVQVYTQGLIVLTVTGLNDHNDVGVTVYATDDNTFTLTTSGGLAIGKLHRWISGTSGVVRFQGATVRSL